MTLSVVETRRNGTGAALQVKTVEIDLGEIGYTGWWVRMRTNPRSSVYDALLDEDVEVWWAAFGKVVLAWNLADEDGEPMPLPSTGISQKELDLPVGVLRYILNQYFAAVGELTALPKAPSDNSAATSSTSEGSPRSE